jgi:single-strand DNA-binding protein
MANLNKVMLIGRLTRDPEAKAFEGGGKVVSFGFAVNNRKRNAQTGVWEDVPVWIDCKAFDRAEGRKMATLIADTVRKGQLLYIEGRLTFEEWPDKDTGAKRTALRVIVEDFQYLTPKEGGNGEGMAPRAERAPSAAPARSGGSGFGAKQPAKPLYEGEPDEPMETSSGRGGDGDDIPF